MREVEELQHELARQQAQINVLIELCVVLLRQHGSAAGQHMLRVFGARCDTLRAATNDATEGADVQVDEVRELYGAICDRFRG